MKNLISQLAKLVIVVAFLIGAGAAAHYCWSNFQTIKQARETIYRTVNEELPQHGIDPVKTVALTNGSVVFGVPDELNFEQALYESKNKVQALDYGTMRGKYNHRTGDLEVHIITRDGDHVDFVRNVNDLPAEAG